jgi:hypothetical protein
MRKLKENIYIKFNYEAKISLSINKNFIGIKHVLFITMKMYIS